MSDLPDPGKLISQVRIVREDRVVADSSSYLDVVVPVLGVASAAFCVWLAVRIYNRRERWAKWTAVGLAVVVAYPLSFGPACRLLPFDTLTTVYWPCICLALDGPRSISAPMMLWADTCGGGVALTILQIDRTPPARLFLEAGEVASDSIPGGDEIDSSDRRR